MIGRVTSQQLAYGAQQTMGASKARLSVLQQQASTGTALTKPSDDPVGTAAALQTRSQIAANTQYGTNISDGLGWVATTDSALTHSEDLVRKARDLTIQAGSTAGMSPSGRAAIAAQLDQIRSDLMGQANATYLGRSVFAGNSDSGTAFGVDGTYSGTNTGTVQRRISANESVAVSADGGAAFGRPAATAADGTAVASTSVFDAIDAVSAALRSSTDDSDTSSTGPQAAISSGITALQASMTRLSDVHSAVGTNYSRLNTAKTQNGTAATALEAQRSGIEDIDTTKVLLDLKTQELAYQTALQVTAAAIQPTLMSFLS